MSRQVSIEIRDAHVSNVKHRMTFAMRDPAPDPEDIVGRIPLHVMWFAAIVQAVGLPGTGLVLEIVEDASGDYACDAEGDIALEEDGSIEWHPAAGRVDGAIIAPLEPAEAAV